MASSWLTNPWADTAAQTLSWVVDGSKRAADWAYIQVVASDTHMEKIVEFMELDDYDAMYKEIERAGGVEFRCNSLWFEKYCVRVFGCTPLLAAAVIGKPACISFLVHHGADVDNPSDLFSTPLFCAAMVGQLACVKQLIKLGADYTFMQDNGLTPFDVASEHGHDDVVTFLLEHDAAVKENWRIDELRRQRVGVEMSMLELPKNAAKGSSVSASSAVGNSDRASLEERSRQETDDTVLGRRGPGQAPVASTTASATAAAATRRPLGGSKWAQGIHSQGSGGAGSGAGGGGRGRIGGGRGREA